MNGVDLKQFQFDYDMTWAGFFLHHDGTVLARYGSRSPKGPMVHNSAKGLVSTMRRVLDAYAKLPVNRELFSAKKGPDPIFATPEAIKGPSGRRRSRVRVGRGNCIHCHNVHERFHDVEMRVPIDGLRRPKTIFKYPLPANLGLSIDRDIGNRITKVRVDSPAAKAGLEKGDDLSVVGGQAIFSIADLQFVLHHLDQEATVNVEIRRDGAKIQTTLRLSRGWKRNDFTWRASMSDFPPDRGLYVYQIPADEKKKLGVAKTDIALEVRGLFKPALERSSLEEGDIILAYDGRTEALGAIEFQNYLRVQHYEPGAVVHLDVLRDGKRLKLDVKLSDEPRASSSSEKR
jgi:hypothetical protein